MRCRKTQLIDKYDRRLNYLRISITDRCNLRCIYCRPGKDLPKLDHTQILRYEEILRLARIAIDLGVTKIRLTGGEPLVRKGVYHFIDELNKLEGLQTLRLTTNGVYLGENLNRLKQAGIRAINVSLDTLDEKKFERITGFNFFQQVWEGIERAREMHFGPIKINMVVMRGINTDEVLDFAKLSRAYPYHIRFIEYMPIGDPDVLSSNLYVSSSEIKKEVKKLDTLIPVTGEVHDGPAERFRFEGAAGEIGFINPISHHFCHNCNRLRLTASGQLKACLLSTEQQDLMGPLRRGCPDSVLANVFLRAVRSKPVGHDLSSDSSSRFPGHMSSIGG